MGCSRCHLDAGTVSSSLHDVTVPGSVTAENPMLTDQQAIDGAAYTHDKAGYPYSGDH